MAALLASAMLPCGLWSSSELSAHADSLAPASTAPTDSGTASADTATAALAAASVPQVAPAAPAKPAAIKPAPAKPEPLLWNVRAVVAGREMKERVEVPHSGTTVGFVLSQMGVEVGPLDRVSPLASEPASNGMSIRVRRVEAPLKTRSQSVPFETRYLPTSTMQPGAHGVLKSGRTGKVEVTERVWSMDGKVTLREHVSRRVVRTPQDKVIGLGSRSAYVPSKIPYHNRYARAYSLSARGGGMRDRLYAAPKLPQGVSGRPLRAVRMVELVATGYSPDPRENGGYTTTATGLPIGYGAAAVDPNVIPLGSKLYVEGYGYAFACDTGGAIKGRRIDLAYNSYSEANTKGHRKVRAWILAE